MYILTALAQSPLFCLFLGGLCYYAALPPLNVAPLALLVPIFWGMVILQKPAILPTAGRRQSRRPDIAVYLAGFLFWLASIWWVACPYPPYTVIGLVVLAAVLAVFWVFFFASARVAVHRFHIPLLIAMPACWIGTEYLRCRFLGGFSFCAIEHAFYLYPPLIQLASLGGGLLVGGMIMFLGAAVLSLFVTKAKLRLLFIMLCIVSLSFYPAKDTAPSGNKTFYSLVALQGNRQVYIDGGVEEAEKTFAQFVHLAYQEIHDRKQAGVNLPDMIVFPETVCPIPVLAFEGSITPADLGWTEEQSTQWERDFRQFSQSIKTPVLLGLSTWFFENDTVPIRLNSALFVPPNDDAVLRYDKMHLVLMGEYVPFAEYLPNDFILRSLCHEAKHGTVPLAIPIGGNKTADGEQQKIYAAVNICFESSVAHLIRLQILTLRRRGYNPRMLINLSNDGWFRKSQAIEQHLATHVFRAVENRMYYVTATNAGFSAIINPYGEIRSMGQRGVAEAVSGEIGIDLSRMQCTTVYQIIGDWYALPLAAAILVLTFLGWRERRRYGAEE